MVHILEQDALKKIVCACLKKTFLRGEKDPKSSYC